MPQAGGRGGRGVWPVGYPGEQRWDLDTQDARDLYRRGMAPRAGYQPDQRVRLLAGGVCGDEGGWRGQDDQHRIDDVAVRGAVCDAVLREQGRAGADDAGAGDGLGEGQHPGERDPCRGWDRYRPDPAARQAARSRGCREKVEARTPGRTVGRAAGSIWHRRVSRQSGVRISLLELEQRSRWTGGSRSSMDDARRSCRHDRAR